MFRKGLLLVLLLTLLLLWWHVVVMMEQIRLRRLQKTEDKHQKKEQPAGMRPMIKP